MTKLEFKQSYESIKNIDVSTVIHGKTGFAKNGDVKLWYEHITPKSEPKATLIFIMGLEMDSMAWPNSLLHAIVNEGFAVIRFDNRCSGLSTYINNTLLPKFSLTHMSQDVHCVLQHLKIKKAIIVGVSMGGMIAQQYSIMYPKSTLGVVSIMSSGNIFDTSCGGTNFKTIAKLAWLGLKSGSFPSEEKMLQNKIEVMHVLRGNANEQLDYKGLGLQLLYNYRIRKFSKNTGGIHQVRAIKLSGSRYKALSQSEIPYLLIHGKNDPLISHKHSEKLATIIPNCESVFITEMGHIFSETNNETIVSSILQFAYSTCEVHVL